jgi:hypothetical protein
MEVSQELPLGGQCLQQVACAYQTFSRVCVHQHVGVEHLAGIALEWALPAP